MTQHGYRGDGAEPYGDRDRIVDEAPDLALIDGMWFTVDEQTPGGVRPVTETEYRAFHDQVAAGAAQAHGRADLVDADQQIQQARHNLSADDADPEPHGYCRTGDYMIRQINGLDDAVDDGHDRADGRGDHP